MAAPTYTTDLNILDDCADSTGWAEPTATGWTSLFAITNGETDYFIEGSACNSATIRAGASGVSIPTDGAFLIWMYFTSPNLLDTYANGGIRTVIGSALNAFYWVKQGGKETYIYGGW